MKLNPEGTSQLYFQTIEQSSNEMTGLARLANAPPGYFKKHPNWTGEMRGQVLRSWLLHNRFSSMPILQALLGFNSEQRLSNWLNQAPRQGEMIAFKTGDRVSRRLVFLTKEGWGWAAEESGSAKPYVEPNKISLRALQHDIIVQRIVLKRLLKKSAKGDTPRVAFESDLGRLTGKKPDAIVGRAAVEVENGPKTQDDASAMIYKLQNMLQGDQGIGSTGIDSVMIYCRAEGILKNFKDVIQSGRASCRRGSISLTPGGIHTQLLPDDPLIQSLVKSMRAW